MGKSEHETIIIGKINQYWKTKLEKDSNWEITSKPMCGAITFRFAPKGYSEAQLDEINSMISKKIIEDGHAFI